MLKRIVADQRCQACRMRSWSCITLLTGLRRCGPCWAHYYLGRLP